MKIYNRFTGKLLIEVKDIKKDLIGANLYKANLGGADLRGADLREVDLIGANLYRADLRGANLFGANLYGAEFRGADLEGADLTGADLRGADLYGADLRGANLMNTCVKTFTLGRHYGFVHESTVTIGCKNFHKEDVNRVMLRKLGKENSYSKEEIKLYSDAIILFMK